MRILYVVRSSRKASIDLASPLFRFCFVVHTTAKILSVIEQRANNHPELLNLAADRLV